ncbi:MAG TPA: phosphatase PAP2 family protein [Methylomirabilota bacterium]|jgi:undecaprenyl-diphosphatase|nr:phosphatase PAP2 family protein [Methylomirabilota bacterium]
MNPFDSSIIAFLNSFARHSWAFDSFVYMISGNDLLKGGVVVALIWWTWFRPSADKANTRQHLICAIFACLVAVVIARGLALLLPFRERPMTVAALHFQRPYGASDAGLIDWSSFPSDHAAVFFALAMSIFFVWRAAGIAALSYVFLFIGMPRLYLGFHYPTDILGGALIGITLALIGRARIFCDWVGRYIMPWSQRSPGSFYACLFILTFQIATLFQSMRGIARFLFSLVQAHNT